MVRVLAAATALGISGLAASFLLLWYSETVLKLPRETIQTLVFQKLLVAGHLTIYVTRNPHWLWSRPFPAGRLCLHFGSHPDYRHHDGDLRRAGPTGRLDTRPCRLSVRTCLATTIQCNCTQYPPSRRIARRPPYPTPRPRRAIAASQIAICSVLWSSAGNRLVDICAGRHTVVDCYILYLNNQLFDCASASALTIATL